MLARIRKATEEKDQGFTLIELLVVMIIIGILAAIAIPVFLNQRKKAVDSSIKSDLRTAANEMETAFTDTQSYPTTVPSTAKKSDASTTITLTLLSGEATAATGSTAATGFCLKGVNTKGSDATNGFIYNSLTGGLKTGSSTVNCP